MGCRRAERRATNNTRPSVSYTNVSAIGSQNSVTCCRSVAKNSSVRGMGDQRCLVPDLEELIQVTVGVRADHPTDDYVGLRSMPPLRPPVSAHMRFREGGSGPLLSRLSRSLLDLKRVTVG